MQLLCLPRTLWEVGEKGVQIGCYFSTISCNSSRRGEGDPDLISVEIGRLLFKFLAQLLICWKGENRGIGGSVRLV
jgi:hypothetical protein